MGMPVHGNPNFSLRLSAEILLFIGFGALALWQWRRVEA
jgi:hypothetical protein